jgi:DNA-binding response OmpR family regulator
VPSGRLLQQIHNPNLHAFAKRRTALDRLPRVRSGRHLRLDRQAGRRPIESPEPHDRSMPKAEPDPNQSSRLHLDEDLRELVMEGGAVPLTPLQFNLLRHLSNHPARVIDRDELVQAVWGRALVGRNVVHASVRSLRKKLGPHASAIKQSRASVIGFGRTSRRDASFRATERAEAAREGAIALAARARATAL